jgi:hypothetical protein
MRLRKASIAARLSVVAAAATAALLVTTAPAFASSDSFTIFTSDSKGCGGAAYIDYGDGAPGGGSNDDYVNIYDDCPDHHGVIAYAWLNGAYLGWAYDGYGSEDSIVLVWDPFKPYGNVHNGDSVGLKVCLVDGASDPTPSYCYSETHSSNG